MTFQQSLDWLRICGEGQTECCVSPYVAVYLIGLLIAVPVLFLIARRTRDLSTSTLLLMVVSIGFGDSRVIAVCARAPGAAPRIRPRRASSKPGYFMAETIRPSVSIVNDRVALPPTFDHFPQLRGERLVIGETPLLGAFDLARATRHLG